MPGYEAADGAQATDEAFKRMFERDKAELRDLGIPLETGRNSHFDAEDGYRIRRGDYELPPIEFDAAEAAAVGLAARLWQSATLGEPARQALIKLRAAGTDVRAADAPGAVPHLDASDPSLPALLEAARTRHRRALRLRQVRRREPPSGARSNRGACCRGGAGGTSPASTATAASRAASGSRASSARSRTVGGPRRVRAAGEGRPARDGGRAAARRRDRIARVRVSGSGAGAAAAHWPQSDDDGVLTISFTETALAGPHHRQRGQQRARARAAGPRRRGRRAAARRRRARRESVMAVSANEERLPRLLALVPYLQARPGIARRPQAAADFGVTEAQLRRDLTLLWMCGLPGHGPGDLIDLSFEGETVSVIFDAGMSRPLRLTAEEALALVVALRTLAETPGLADTDAVQRALAKVEAAAGRRGGRRDRRRRTRPRRAAAAGAAARAVDERRALRLRYYSASRDETTERTVDPVRMFEADGRNYLEAWCRRAEGMRVFRARPHRGRRSCSTSRRRCRADVQLRDLSEGVFQPASEHLLVDAAARAGLRLGRRLLPDRGRHRRRRRLARELRVADPAWVRALVLGSAGQVEVLSPDWLAEDIRGRTALPLRPALTRRPASASEVEFAACSGSR